MNQHTTARQKPGSPYHELIADLVIVQAQRQAHEKHGLPTERDDKLVNLAIDRLIAEWRWQAAVHEPVQRTARVVGVN